MRLTCSVSSGNYCRWGSHCRRNRITAGGLHWRLWKKLLCDGIEQRTWTLTTSVLEVIKINGPCNSSSEAPGLDVVCFDFDGLWIVVTNPLIAFVGVRAYRSRMVCHYMPAGQFHCKPKIIFPVITLHK